MRPFSIFMHVIIGGVSAEKRGADGKCAFRFIVINLEPKKALCFFSSHVKACSP